MTRTISSQTVIGFAQHIPNEEVELVKVENLEFKDKVLTGASGKVSCKLMTEVICRYVVTVITLLNVAT